MILAALVGWSLQHFAGYEHAILPAVLIGLLIAPFVPVRGACAAPERERPGPGR